MSNLRKKQPPYSTANWNLIKTYPLLLDNSEILSFPNAASCKGDFFFPLKKKKKDHTESEYIGLSAANPSTDLHSGKTHIITMVTTIIQNWTISCSPQLPLHYSTEIEGSSTSQSDLGKDDPRIHLTAVKAGLSDYTKKVFLLLYANSRICQRFWKQLFKDEFL